MVEDYFEYSLDVEWLKDSYDALKTEYEFWQTKRIAPNGLNRYWRNYDCEKLGADEGWINWYSRRHGEWVLKLSREEKIDLQTQKTAEGEGGEDHTPRYGGKAADVNPIDLNCYLYGFEKTMARFASILGNGESEVWLARAERRLALINNYCFDEATGVYFDYNYKTGQRTGIYCGACYIPFIFGITDNLDALEKINARLVQRHGVSPCQMMPPDGDVYQWGYPNSWAPNNWWAYLANNQVGNHETAKTIIKNYLDTISTEFEKSGKLYEKYDAVHGGKAVVNEYEVPEMLGWTAGVFSRFFNILQVE
jgi:alpha,alpha-trehalase